jgi:uncharacterized protein YihD (DUF1040 family)
MRDPKRIEKVLNLLRNKWYEYPDLRLGQLMVNLTPEEKDLFYLEDDDLMKEIYDYHLPVLVNGDEE